MAFIVLKNGRTVGDFMKPYIVAELNTSHFGDIDTAKRMIVSAKKSGCDCVKFQSWSSDTLYSDSYYKNNAIAKRIIKKFSLSEADLKELALFSKDCKIDFASTPYSIEEARFLIEECDVPFVKIASMELNNLPFLDQLARLGVPLVLSTGMGTSEEIIDAVDCIRNTGNNSLCVLHCTSLYPSPPEIIRLNNILGLRSEFPMFPIGYSDHSIGIEIPAASIALGACLIEKHFTLDSSKIGMDNQMATEPEEMKAMVSACHNVFMAMGGANRVLTEAEEQQRGKMRRSMITKRDLVPGDIITEETVEFKRPGNGIPPSEFYKFKNRRICKALESGSIVSNSDVI